MICFGSAVIRVQEQGPEITHDHADRWKSNTHSRQKTRCFPPFLANGVLKPCRSKLQTHSWSRGRSWWFIGQRKMEKNGREISKQEPAGQALQELEAPSSLFFFPLPLLFPQGLYEQDLAPTFHGLPFCDTSTSHLAVSTGCTLQITHLPTYQLPLCVAGLT